MNSEKIILMDGALGTSLWEKNTVKVPVWRYNIENPRSVRELHEEFIKAGADIIMANTFAANGIEVSRMSSYRIEKVVSTAVRIANDAADGRVKVGLVAGPISTLLEPYGKLSYETAKAVFEEQIGSGMAEKPDLILLETFMDLRMLLIAASAADIYNVPILCSMSFMGANSRGIRPMPARTMMGDTITDIVYSLGKFKNIVAVGLNCALDPLESLPILSEFIQERRLPALFRPNARKLVINSSGKINTATEIEAFADGVVQGAKSGASYVGGCCGTNADYIRRIAEKLQSAGLR